MYEISPRTMAPRIEHIRYVYEKSDNLFENFMQPIAVYEPDGKIVLATSTFRELACITQDDIDKGCVNIFECMNGDNANVFEAARAAFKKGENIVPTPVRPLHCNINYIGLMLDDYTHAVFFPICYLDYGHEEVDCGAVLLVKPPMEEGADADEIG